VKSIFENELKTREKHVISSNKRKRGCI